MAGTELSTGRMDPRVGSGRVRSGHDFVGFWLVGSGQRFGFCSLFTDYFLVPKLILIFKYYTFGLIDFYYI